jgi:hypothetical protein
MECDFAIALPYQLRLQDNTGIFEDLRGQHSRTLGTTREDFKIRDGNGQGRVRVKHLPVRWHTRLSLLYPYPPNITGKNSYPYPYPQGTRRVKGYPMGININMSLSSYLRVQ